MTELSAAADATPHIDTEFDEHGHAEDMGTPVVFYEPRQGTLYLSWGAACHWYAIAPALAFGVADDNRLAQIRLHGLTLAPRRGNPACGELTIRR
ncbi:hypothetical protein [Paraburkholderia sprentiae]|nr:hypothetical protein [Paraburkholderia sprentiae]